MRADSRFFFLWQSLLQVVFGILTGRFNARYLKTMMQPGNLTKVISEDIMRWIELYEEGKPEGGREEREGVISGH